MTHDEDRRLASDQHPDLPIEDFLARVEDGRFLEDAERGLHEIVAALHRAERHGAAKPKAKLTLSVVFVMDRGVVDVQPNIAVVTPKPRRGGTLFFATPRGRLVKEDQVSQTTLPGIMPAVETTAGTVPTAAPPIAVTAPAAPPVAVAPAAPAPVMVPPTATTVAVPAPADPAPTAPPADPAPASSIDAHMGAPSDTTSPRTLRAI